MSEDYRPPTGPRSTRGGNNDQKKQYTSNQSSQRGDRNYKGYKNGDSYTPLGPRRYQERERNNIKRYPLSGGKKAESEQYPRYRPTGPSGYRKNEHDYNYQAGAKRPFPSEPKGYRNNEDLRKRQDRRDYNSYNSFGYKERNGTYSGSKFSDNKKEKLDLKNLPKGPRLKEPTKDKKVNDMIPKKPLQRKLRKSQLYLVLTWRSSDIYKRVQQVGKGTYGKVYKAKNTISEEYVAMKKLRLEKEREGFPITAMREIKLLQSFDHENVVGLLEMMIEHNNIYMILDYMDHDLKGLLSHPDLKLNEGHRKCIFKQLMQGLSYLHRKRVIHRDIKGSNILLNNDGVLKITDFGLARTMNPFNEGETPDYTNRVITIWYRPPELLLGSTEYGREVDVWGVGCLLIELYSKVAAFQGFDEVGQLHKIFNVMGTPSIGDWPDMENLPWFEMLKPRINKASNFANLYRDIMSEQLFNLALKLLALNPKTRLTADEALQDDYFTKDPAPEPLTFLKDLKGEWHEFESKKWRMERKRLQEGNVTNSSSGQVQPQSTVRTLNENLESAPNSVQTSDLKN